MHQSSLTMPWYTLSFPLDDVHSTLVATAKGVGAISHFTALRVAARRIGRLRPSSLLSPVEVVKSIIMPRIIIEHNYTSGVAWWQCVTMIPNFRPPMLRNAQRFYTLSLAHMDLLSS